MYIQAEIQASIFLSTFYTFQQLRYQVSSFQSFKINQSNASRPDKPDHARKIMLLLSWYSNVVISY